MQTDVNASKSPKNVFWIPFKSYCRVNKIKAASSIIKASTVPINPILG